MTDFMRPVRAVLLAATSGILLAIPSYASAQAGPAAGSGVQPQIPRTPPKPVAPDTRKWEVEFHRGFASGDAPTGGSGTLPAPGESFNTAGGSPSRHVPSWLFGDGAALVNDVLSSFGRAERVTPLDDLLKGNAALQEVDHAFGVRVTRRLSSRMAVEVSYERSPVTFTVTDAARTSLENTRASFVQTFAGIVSTGQGVAFLNPVMSASATATDGKGTEALVTGALVFGPRPRGRFAPYVLAGGGVARASGDARAHIEGRYAFRLPSGGQIDERDEVDVRFGPGTGIVVVAGAGLTIRLLGPSGVRLDARVNVVQDYLHTFVDARPSSAESLPADAIWSSLTPGIQFVTHPSTNLKSNLSAPAISSFRTHRGTAFGSRTSLGLGYFFRF